MNVNWFEGGRRITKLAMATAALVGTYNLFFEVNYPPVEFFTKSPRDGWHLNSPDSYSDLAELVCPAEEFLYNYEIKPGLVRNISLCFQPDENGKLIIYSTEEELNYLKKVEQASNRAASTGETEDAKILALEAARVRQSIQKANEAGLKTLTDDEFAPDVQGYIKRRATEFTIDPKVVTEIDKTLPKIERKVLFDHSKQILSITACFVVGLWLLSFLIGWIARGFAGIPRGQDFCPNRDRTTDS